MTRDEEQFAGGFSIAKAGEARASEEAIVEWIAEYIRDSTDEGKGGAEFIATRIVEELKRRGTVFPK